MPNHHRSSHVVNRTTLYLLWKRNAIWKTNIRSNRIYMYVHACFGLSVCDLCSHLFQNSSLEILILRAMALGGRAFERCLGHDGGSLMNEISILIRKKTPQSFLATSTMWGYKKKSATSKKALTQPCWHPDLRLSASRLWKVNFCCL